MAHGLVQPDLWFQPGSSVLAQKQTMKGSACIGLPTSTRTSTCQEQDRGRPSRLVRH